MYTWSFEGVNITFSFRQMVRMKNIKILERGYYFIPKRILNFRSIFNILLLIFDCYISNTVDRYIDYQKFKAKSPYNLHFLKYVEIIVKLKFKN